MIVAVDTNVLVRLLVKDHPGQTAAAVRLLDQCFRSGDKVLVMLCALLETEWVLRTRYRFGKTAVAEAFAQLLQTQEVAFEHEPTVEEALRAWSRQPRSDFADCLLSARAAQLGAERFVTLDADASRLPGAVLLA